VAGALVAGSGLAAGVLGRSGLALVFFTGASVTGTDVFRGAAVFGAAEVSGAGALAATGRLDVAFVTLLTAAETVERIRAPTPRPVSAMLEPPQIAPVVEPTMVTDRDGTIGPTWLEINPPRRSDPA